MFFSGAGVSTESGLPDFRGEQGLYSKKYGQLPEWEKQGKLRAAITQNTDGLHQAAGSKSVYRCA